MEFLKDLIARVQDDDVPGVAAELAFRFMFALFPFLIFLAALSSYVAGWLGIENPTQEILAEVGAALPEDAASILESQLLTIFDTQRPGLLTVTAVLALWSASSGTKTVMKALNRAYDVEEERPFLRKQAVGLLLTLVGGVAFLVGAVVLVVGQAAGHDIASAVGLGETFSQVATWLRIPVVLLLILVATAFVYWSAPAADLTWRWFSWGAAIFVVSWLVATIGFAFYVANFANYQGTYGSLGGIIILMTWLYITALVLILGAEVNVALERRVLGAAVPEGVQDSARASRRSSPEEVQVERRMPRPAARQGVSGALSSALGALVAGVVLVRLWR
ncbi:MAG: YihY/virulence factor BrkB family protein [Dehalococcoidia bacterium]|nr:YihY/virulence factor BrkB family protein [Dehalococcoidia bacterium]